MPWCPQLVGQLAKFADKALISEIGSSHRSISSKTSVENIADLSESEAATSIMPVVPHKAVAEDSKIGNLLERSGCCNGMAERTR